MREHLALLRAEPVHQLRDALGAEEAHQIILEREEELCGAGIALAARAPAQLPVDAPRLVALGSDDVQAAVLHHLELFAVGILDLRRLRLRDALAQLDVGSATGHVRRDRHRAGLPRLGHDLGLALVVLRVQHVVPDAGALEHARERLRHVDVHGSHEHGIAEVVEALRLLENRVVLLAARAIDPVLPVIADHRLVRRNHGDIELVDVVELRLLRLGRARHARELLVHAEVVLDRDRRHGLGLALHLHPFLGLDRLVQPLGPAPARHRAAGELIDDEHLPVLHDVIHVLLVQRVRAQQLMHDVQPLAALGIGALDRRARVELLLRRERCVVIDAMHLFRDVREQERIGITRAT